MPQRRAAGGGHLGDEPQEEVSGGADGLDYELPRLEEAPGDGQETLLEADVPGGEGEVLLLRPRRPA